MIKKVVAAAVVGCFVLLVISFVGPLLSVGDLYAAPSEQGLEHGKGHDKDKGKGKDDKDHGPSVPGIPMAAAVLIGLGGIGAGVWHKKKKKR